PRRPTPLRLSTPATNPTRGNQPLPLLRWATALPAPSSLATQHRRPAPTRSTSSWTGCARPAGAPRSWPRLETRHDVPMRIARVARGERVVFGRVEGGPGSEEIVPLTGDVLAGEARPAGRERYRLVDLRLLPPVQPSKIVAVGRNYADHAAELAHDIPERPR